MIQHILHIWPTGEPLRLSKLFELLRAQGTLHEMHIGLTTPNQYIEMTELPSAYTVHRYGSHFKRLADNELGACYLFRFFAVLPGKKPTPVDPNCDMREVNCHNPSYGDPL